MKRNFVAKIMAIVLIAAMLLTGCGGGKTNEEGNNEQLLEIYVLEQGYGSDWARNTVEAFKEQDWVKEKYPELQIKTTFNDRVYFARDQLALGEKDNTFDLLFGYGFGSYCNAKDLVDLTEVVYNAKVPGEEITYSEKLNDSLEAGMATIDDETGETSYFMAPYYSGVYGFIYNEDALKTYGEVPRTTDEFIAICHKIKNENASKYANEDPTAQYVFMQSKDAPYWEKEGSALEAWWAQYEGVQGYDDFFNGIVNGQRSKDIFKQKGRLESLKVIETLLDYDNGFINPQSFSQEFMVAQTGFLQGAAVFHYNGDYFVDEMKETVDRLVAANYEVPTIKMMKTPIISSIIEKCTTIENDAELSALVKAIDANSSALKGEGYDVSKKDFNKIKEARSVVCSVGPAQSVIPAYAKGKDIAIDFLRFMATDRGIVEYAKGTSGSTLDFYFDLQETAPEVYETLSPLHKDRIAYMSNKDQPINILKKGSTYKLCAVGGVKPFVNDGHYTTLSNSTNTVTAQDFYDDTIKHWTDSAWSMALSLAGLSN